MRTLVVLIATLFLTACAGMSANTTRATLKPNEYEVDYARVAMVERQAKMNWGRVVWVSMPTKKVDTTQPE